MANSELPPSLTTTFRTSTSTKSTFTASVTVSPATTTKPSNGITTPNPVQPSMVSNCDKFYLVKQGDTCDGIVKSNGITLTQLLQWNAEAGASCTGLLVDASACVSIIAHKPSTPPTTTAIVGNGIATPAPAQPSMVSNCDRFYKVASGDTCATIASKFGISVAQILTSNQGWARAA